MLSPHRKSLKGERESERERERAASFKVMPPSLGAVHIFKEKANLLNRMYTKPRRDHSQKGICGQSGHINAWRLPSNLGWLWRASLTPELPVGLADAFVQLLPGHLLPLPNRALTLTNMFLRAPTLKNFLHINLRLRVCCQTAWALRAKHKHRRVHRS